jgi:hypothetical protein
MWYSDVYITQSATTFQCVCAVHIMHEYENVDKRCCSGASVLSNFNRVCVSNYIKSILSANDYFIVLLKH